MFHAADKMTQSITANIHMFAETVLRIVNVASFFLLLLIAQKLDTVYFSSTQSSLRPLKHSLIHFDHNTHIESNTITY